MYYATFDKLNLPLYRNVVDQTVNNYGNMLIEMCKSNNLFLLNGRIGSDFGDPKYTCRGCSTVDYFVSSSNVLTNIIDFHVHKFCHLLSDVHCPLSLVIECKNVSKCEDDTTDNFAKIPKLWDKQKENNFVNNIDISLVEQIQDRLDLLDSITVCPTLKANEIAAFRFKFEKYFPYSAIRP